MSVPFQSKKSKYFKAMCVKIQWYWRSIMIGSDLVIINDFKKPLFSFTWLYVCLCVMKSYK